MRSLLFVALLAAVCNAEPITYQLTSYEMATDEPSDESYAVSGYIQTDGTLGKLDRVNIVDFEVNVDGPMPYTLTVTPETSIIVNRVRGAFATANDLYIELTDSGIWSVLEITDVGGFGTIWSASPAASDEQPNFNHGPYTTATGFQVGTDHSFLASLRHADSTRITVGTVPEPAAGVLLAVGLLAGVALRRRKFRYPPPR